MQNHHGGSIRQWLVLVQQVHRVAFGWMSMHKMIWAGDSTVNKGHKQFFLAAQQHYTNGWQTAWRPRLFLEQTVQRILKWTCLHEKHLNTNVGTTQSHSCRHVGGTQGRYRLLDLLWCSVTWIRHYPDSTASQTRSHWSISWLSWIHRMQIQSWTWSCK